MTVVSPLTPEVFQGAYELAAEWLGQSGADALADDYAAHAELALALHLDGRLVGLAFGHPFSEDQATLEGIAVRGEHTAHGLGSLLLGQFEDAARKAGYRRVGLGSAGGYVERFYCKNGYEQTEYMVVVPDGERKRLDLDGLSVVRRRHWEPDLLVLNVAAPDGYSPKVKAALAERLGATEVCCIFQKSLA